jgi:hypothetical protein
MDGDVTPDSGSTEEEEEELRARSFWIRVQTILQRCTMMMTSIITMKRKLSGC